MSICKTFIIIPARLASTRLPNKLLLNETGKPLIQYAYESARGSKLAAGVLIACDDSRIFEAVEAFGGTPIMTDPNAASGTDRIAEVAQKLEDTEIIVNVQGDEPNLCPESIDFLIELLISHPEAVMATLATPSHRKEDLDDPACVKVVFDSRGQALYFSRAPIPYPRNWSDDMLIASPPLFYQHLGIYAYRRNYLLSLRQKERTTLEKTENLEQLRAIQSGDIIMVGVVEDASFGIDTPEDYRRFVESEKEKKCVL